MNSILAFIGVGVKQAATSAGVLFDTGTIAGAIYLKGLDISGKALNVYLP